MRPNLIAMKNKFPIKVDCSNERRFLLKPDLNQARTYLARVLKLTSQRALHNANSKGTTPHESAQLLQEQAYTVEQVMLATINFSVFPLSTVETFFFSDLHFSSLYTF